MELHTLTAIAFKYLEGKVEKLNKRAEKLGVMPIRIENVRKYTELVQTGSTINPTELVQKVEFSLEGSKPVVQGYKVIAVLENVEGENVIKYSLGETEEKHGLVNYRSRTECDHCNHSRKRKHTYILQDETTGKYLQVGRTCLKDFLEGDITYLVMYAKLSLDTIEKEARENSGGSVPEYVGIETFIAMTIEFVNDEGYASSKSLFPTGVRVWDEFFKPLKFRKYDLGEVIEKNKKEAEEIVEWAKGLKGDESDYKNNLWVIANSGEVTYSLKGFASSMVVAYRREHGEEVETEVKEEKKEKPKKEEIISKHFGVVGEKRGAELTVKKVLTFEGKYGTVNMLLMRESDGSEVKWTTGTKHKMEEGKTYKVMCNIKEHGEYNGVKQTTVTYVNVRREIKN